MNSRPLPFLNHAIVRYIRDEKHVRNEAIAKDHRRKNNRKHTRGRHTQYAFDNKYVFSGGRYLRGGTHCIKHTTSRQNQV